MSPRILLILCLAVMAIATVSAIKCPCGSGEDVCDCFPSMALAQKLKKPCPKSRTMCTRYDPPKYTLTDPCCCKHNKVFPARKQRPRCMCGESDPPAPCNNYPVATIPFTREDLHPGYEPDYPEERKRVSTGVNCCEEQAVSLVDPISLYLANSRNTNTGQKFDEARISYGFYKMPEDKPIQKQFGDVNEDALNCIRKKVLELKEDPKKKVFAEEDISSEEECGSQTACSPSYADLGYVPVNSRSCPALQNPFTGQDSYYFDPDSSYRYESRTHHRQSEERHSSEMKKMHFFGKDKPEKKFGMLRGWE